LKNRCMVIHLTLVPFLAASGELKTKPTQHSVKTLLEAGVQPDVLVLRTEHPLTSDIKNKVANFCNVQKESVVESRDVSTIYEVPVEMQREKLDEIVLNHFNMELGEKPDMKAWKSFLTKYKNPKHQVNIALVGKYVELKDAYKSINESFIHAGAANEARVNINYVHSENINETNYAELLGSADGIIVTPGFGHRGIAGKVLAAQYARENNVPYFGICLGMQIAVIEFAKNVLKLEDPNSLEMDSKCKNPVINLMEEQKMVTEKGGTMRLGSYPCRVSKDSNAFNAYNTVNINERHRHRYEFNSSYQEMYAEAGMIATGINPETELVEIVEIPKHKWFVGVQFHPEYKSTVTNPHPLFVSFVKAAIGAK